MFTSRACLSAVTADCWAAATMPPELSDWAHGPIWMMTTGNSGNPASLRTSALRFFKLCAYAAALALSNESFSPWNQMKASH